jgi:rod shape-determining protein MreC
MRNILRLISKNYLILLFLLLEGLSFILIFQFNAFQRTFFVNASRNLTGGLYSSVSSLREYIDLQQQVDILKTENSRLRNELNHNREYVYMSDSLVMPADSAVESFFQRSFYSPARVINNSVNRQFNYITLNKGNLQGVKKDMGVVSDMGVVGVVIGSSQNYSSVIPVINRNSRISSRIRGSDNFGILEWDGRNPAIAQLNEIPVHVNVSLGDTIVTSGYSAIFPAGEIVGTIESFNPGQGNFMDIDVRLAVDFSKLLHVYVVHRYFQEEQTKLESALGYD